MKKSVSLLANLLLSSTLFWGVPMAYGEELGSGQVVRVPANSASYCHMKFPPMRESTGIANEGQLGSNHALGEGMSLP
jgi:hypothetical protein